MKITKEKYNVLQGAGKISRMTIALVMEVLSCSNAEARVWISILESEKELKGIFGDEDVIEANVKLAGQKQKMQDLRRIDSKTFREYARMHNALTAMNESLIEVLDNVKFHLPPYIQDIKITEGDQAIVQLADTHFNELVDLTDNHYDFEVAAKRMALYAMEAKRLLKSYGVQKIILAMTGDMINSDRRLDEKLNMSTNRMTAVMLGVKLINYFICDLADEFDLIDVVYVTGNESRVDEFGFTDMVVTDNYDSIIFNILADKYEGHQRVKFLRTNPVETVIRVNGRNVLLLHGTTLGANATQQAIQKYYGKYANKGTPIHYSLFGHVHYCNIGDTFGRSGSLVGSNTYSEFALGLTTKASQNVHLFRKDGTMHNFRIELQQTEGIIGYPIEKDIQAYNAKSASKMHRRYKVVEIENSAGIQF